MIDLDDLYIAVQDTWHEEFEVRHKRQPTYVELRQFVDSGDLERRVRDMMADLVDAAGDMYGDR